MSTVCKLFPDAEICKDPGLISSMEEEGEKLLKQAEGELLPTICKLFPDADICDKTGPPIDINLTSGLKRQMERRGNQMERQEALVISKRHQGRYMPICIPPEWCGNN